MRKRKRQIETPGLDPYQICLSVGHSWEQFGTGVGCSEDCFCGVMIYACERCGKTLEAGYREMMEIMKRCENSPHYENPDIQTPVDPRQLQLGDW